MVQRPRPDLRGGCAAMRIPTATGGRGAVMPPPTRPARTAAPARKSPDRVPETVDADMAARSREGRCSMIGRIVVGRRPDKVRRVACQMVFRAVFRTGWADAMVRHSQSIPQGPQGHPVTRQSDAGPETRPHGGCAGPCGPAVCPAGSSPDPGRRPRCAGDRQRCLRACAQSGQPAQRRRLSVWRTRFSAAYPP